MPALRLLVASWAALTFIACQGENPAYRGQVMPGPPPVEASSEIPPLLDAAVDGSGDLPAGDPQDAGPGADVPALAPDAEAGPDAPAEDVQSAEAAPPDAAPPAPKALLVVGNAMLELIDDQMRNRLLTGGYLVTVKDDEVVSAGDATGKAVVIISGSSVSDVVGNKFKDVAVPVVVYDSFLFPEMGMTGTADDEFGSGPTEDRIVVTGAPHPLAAGLAGTVTVTRGKLFQSWGVPGPSAVRVAHVFNVAERISIFGYDQGAPMVGLTAPARRVGCFTRYPNGVTFTDDGWLLFDACVKWAAGR
jgi:hypothetical protein